MGKRMIQTAEAELRRPIRGQGLAQIDDDEVWLPNKTPADVRAEREAAALGHNGGSARHHMA